MSYAIIRGSNGRRHEVDFGNAEIGVDVAIGSEFVQITVEAVHDLVPSDKWPFATMAIPRAKFAAALVVRCRRKIPSLRRCRTTTGVTTWIARGDRCPQQLREKR